MIYKRFIKKMVQSAKELQAMTTGTTIVFNIYADSCFVLDNEEDNVLDVVYTEEEAIETCKGVNSGEFSDDSSKSNVYYKPALVDKDSGELITRKNWKAYAKPEHKNYL